jgi:hypothetical protein
MTDVRQQLDGRTAAVALVTTPAGGWLLGWDPQMATFTAGHVGETGPGGTARFDHELGSTRAAYPSAGALEEGLGFALPSTVRAALEAQRDAHPALAAPRGMEVGVGEVPPGPRDVGTFPVWSSEATAATGPGGGSTVGWGLAVERDRERHAAVVDLGQGTLLEVLGSRPEPASGSTLVSYRLCHDGRVVLAGDDVRAPAGADVAADDSVRALLAVVVDPDPLHRGREFGAGSRGFLEAHGDRLLDAAAGPPAPYPAGTRVAVDVDGRRHLGRVAYSVVSRQGEALAYAWTPDVASLVGHPWRRGISRNAEPERTLITPAAKVTPTVAGPEIGVPGPGEALVFGALVAAAHPDTGDRVEATVLRAFGGGDGVVYQVEPHTLDDTEPLMVRSDQIALLRGTWWPSAADLMAARHSAGLSVVPGEILPGGSGDDSQLAFFTPDSPEPSQRRAVTPVVTAAQREAALLVGLDPVPSAVTIDILGELARVGDPDHGWLVVPADRLMAAMAKPVEQLRAIVSGHALTAALNGNESVPTLAALAVCHAPDQATGNPPVAAAPGPPRHLRVVRDNQAGL